MSIQVISFIRRKCEIGCPLKKMEVQEQSLSHNLAVVDMKNSRMVSNAEILFMMGFVLF